MKLVYRPEALDDLDDAYEWYEQQRDGLGEEFLESYLSLIGRILQFPELYGVLLHDVRAAPLRRFPYVVFYRAEQDRIVVIAVQHGSRGSKRWQSRI